MTIPKLNHSDEWKFTHRGVPVSVRHHCKDNENIAHGHGIWNYYVYIHERNCPRFAEIWLEDKRIKYSEQGQEHLTHDYLGSLVDSVHWHGGCTFYAKHGTLEGFRCVEVGCDFNHLWDEPYHGSYNENEVAEEAMRTVDELIDLLQIKTPEKAI